MSANNLVRRTAAIITARGGSKGIPGKNVRTIGGKPLIAWTIEASLRSGVAERTFVSTDDPEIAEISRRFGAEVVDRPGELAGDRSTSHEAIDHALSAIDRLGFPADSFVLLQPTSPLRNAELLREAVVACESANGAGTLSVCEVDHHPYKMFLLESASRLEPLKDAASLSQPRQLLPPVVRQNGAIYYQTLEQWRKTHEFYFPGILPFIMPARLSIDIDTLDDFELCERRLHEAWP